MVDLNLIKIQISFSRIGKNRIEINFPNVLAQHKFGKPEIHYFSPESLDKGLPIVIDTTFPVRVSNVLFVAMEKKSEANVLYTYSLPEFVTINQSATIIVPWIEAFKAAQACLQHQRSKNIMGNFYIVVYDQFTNKWYKSNRNLRPLSLHTIATECDPILDKKYEEVFGFSLRKLLRAESSQEKMKILGISEKDLQRLIKRAKKVCKILVLSVLGFPLRVDHSVLDHEVAPPADYLTPRLARHEGAAAEGATRQLFHPRGVAQVVPPEYREFEKFLLWKKI